MENLSSHANLDPTLENNNYRSIPTNTDVIEQTSP